MKSLWAPWRMEFILEPKKPGCVFCTLPKETDDRKNLIIWRRQNVFAILNKYPYNTGHVMVVPNTHAATLKTLDTPVLSQLMETTSEVISALEHIYEPNGFNIGMNLGLAGGAGIADHIHMHVIPRWHGDTNFMPILSETKAIPQHLAVTFDKFSEYFKKR